MVLSLIAACISKIGIDRKEFFHVAHTESTDMSNPPDSC